MRTRLANLLFLGPAVALTLAATSGCGVKRTLQIDSDPPGALVYLNGDEVGRTPMRKDFLWYGTYDVELRKEGYQTLVKPAQVWAPWWQWPPIDFVAELVPLPLEDSHAIKYELSPITIEQADPEEILNRAVAMRGKLRGAGTPHEAGEKPKKQPKPKSHRKPTTTTTKPSSVPAPTTQPSGAPE